jgi:hypothetical protein
MKRTEANSYSETEQRALRALLEASPGVRKVNSLEKHLKGGYAVALDVDGAQRGELADHLSSNGLMLVM